MPYISSLIISFSLFINISTKHISSNAQDIHINSLPMYNEYAPPIPAPQANTNIVRNYCSDFLSSDLSPILMYALMDSIALLIFPMHIVLAYG